MDPVVAAVVGMAALAVGIVGGPATMTFLVLEATSNLAITGLVLVAAIAVRSRCGCASAIPSPLGACICEARAFAARMMWACCANSPSRG